MPPEPVLKSCILVVSQDVVSLDHQNQIERAMNNVMEKQLSVKYFDANILASTVKVTYD